MTAWTFHRRLGLAALICTAVGVTVPMGHAAEESRMIATGEELYMSHCAACHGADGTGEGPVSRYFNVEPTDLTMLSKNNEGHFPFMQVFNTIDGRKEVRGHGTGQMPVWGDTFTAQVEGRTGPHSSEPFVRARITELTFYIQSIQK